MWPLIYLLHLVLVIGGAWVSAALLVGRSRDRSPVVSLGIFSRGSFRQTHVSWGRLNLWKWVSGNSPGVKAAGAFGWRPTTLAVPKVEKIQGLNLPGTPRATSACRGIRLLYFTGNRKGCFYPFNFTVVCKWSGFLGALAKLRKTPISFVMSVCLSVRMQQLGSQWTDFYEISHLRICRKSVEKIQVSLKSDKNEGHFTCSSRPIYFSGNMSLSSS